MKIAMLGAKAVPAIGGIALYIEEVGARLASRGHDVTVYCRPHYLQEGAVPYRGMRRVVTGGLQGKHLDASTHTLSSVLRAARGNFDIVHFHGIGPGALAPLLGRRRQSRVIITVHGLDWQRSKWGRTASGLMYAGTRFSARFADEITTVSQCVGEEYHRRVGRKPSFVPTGVTLPEMMPPQELQQLGLVPNEYLFCATRLVPEKGLHYLLEAFAGLDTNKKLVIAGNCPYEDPYVQRLKQMASDQVVFAGYVKGRLLAELYSHAYLYLQPSEIEGLSISVLEALSYGRYVLASDIPENQEALETCGGTFRCGDVEDLRNKLGGLLDQPDVVREQCEVARSFISQKRNWETTTDCFERLYAGLFSQATPSGICAQVAHSSGED
jgi:glycosyltransferase involved in cell wall biosynthesis